MIVGIVKIETGMEIVQEFRKAVDELTAVNDFCNEYNPALNVADYLGVNADSLDLQSNWGWDFSGLPPLFVEILPNPMKEVFTQSEIDGREYFKFAKATYFGIHYKNEILTLANLDYCYTKLNEVSSRLNNGDFELAHYYLLNEIPPITQTDINNGYTQEIHDKLVTDLNTYIVNV